MPKGEVRNTYRGTTDKIMERKIGMGYREPVPERMERI